MRQALFALAALTALTGCVVRRPHHSAPPPPRTVHPRTAPPPRVVHPAPRPAPPARPPAHAPAVGVRAHHWVYYPDAQAYGCDVHHHYWVRDDGRWVERKTVSFALAGGVVLSLTRDDPFAEFATHRGQHLGTPRGNGHHWRYYPAADVYYCDRHDRYWVADGGKWVVRPRVTVALGDPVVLTIVDATPYVHVAEHRAKYRKVKVKPVPPGRVLPGPKPGKGPRPGKPGKGKGRGRGH